MKNKEVSYFELLKRKIVETMKQSYPEINNNISEWKGQEIIDFQEDLMSKEKAYISEKWFYTHMKTVNSKLPRIDILNFLSRYTGFKAWKDFKYKNTNSNLLKKHTDRSNQVFILIPIITLISIVIIALFTNSFYTKEYSFCFYNADTKEPITNSIIEISIPTKGESSVNYLCDTNGCFTLKTNKRVIRFIVQTSLYKPDTINRTLNKFNRTENIKLTLDDFSAMLHYFLNNQVDDWMKRRERLNQLISDSAKIFQVMEGTIGMDIYNKWDFINMLTMPTNSLRAIEILNTQYFDDKIIRIRFKINNWEK